MKSYRMTKEIVSHIAYLVQLGILTGTDIVGMLMSMVLDDDGQNLKLNENYLKSIENEVDNMLKKIEELSKKNENDGPGFIS